MRPADKGMTSFATHSQEMVSRSHPSKRQFDWLSSVYGRPRGGTERDPPPPDMLPPRLGAYLPILCLGEPLAGRNVASHYVWNEDTAISRILRIPTRTPSIKASSSSDAASERLREVGTPRREIPFNPQHFIQLLMLIGPSMEVPRLFMSVPRILALPTRRTSSISS